MIFHGNRLILKNDLYILARIIAGFVKIHITERERSRVWTIDLKRKRLVNVDPFVTIYDFKRQAANDSPFDRDRILALQIA